MIDSPAIDWEFQLWFSERVRGTWSVMTRDPKSTAFPQMTLFPTPLTPCPFEESFQFHNAGNDKKLELSGSHGGQHRANSVKRVQRSSQRNPNLVQPLALGSMARPSDSTHQPHNYKRTCRTSSGIRIETTSDELVYKGFTFKISYQ